MSLVSPLLGIILLLCIPAFAIHTAILNDTVVLAGDSTILNCSGSNINWYHYLLGDERSQYNDIFMDDNIMEEYSALGFSIDGNQNLHDSFSSEESQPTAIRGGDKVGCVANSSQSCSYKWVWYEKVGNDLSRTIESNENLPECYVNLDEFIGPNDCNLPLDDILLSSSVRYRGNKAPELEWRKHGETEYTLEQENKQWTPAVISFLILGVLPHIAFGCYLFTLMHFYFVWEDILSAPTMKHLGKLSISSVILTK